MADITLVKPVDLEWLAGLLEGEGSFIAAKPPHRHSPLISLAMCDEDVVARAALLMGRRRVYRTEPRRPGYRPVFICKLNGDGARRLMRDLLPLMGERRATQIAIATGATCGSTPVRSIEWLAGLLEGEGSFTSASPRGGSPSISLQMCDRDLVELAAKMLGAPGLYRRTEGVERGWRPTYQIRAQGRSAVAWMHALRPYLGARRQGQIDRALASWHPVYLSPAPATCVVPGCDRPHRGRGLCHPHYMRWSRHRATGKDSDIKPLR